MVTVEIPTLETERLILRAPTIEDSAAFAAFLKTARSVYVGGPVADTRAATRAFGHVAGLWVLRGVSSFTGCLRDGTPIGFFGPWWPANWPETEFGWSLWDAAHEGQGYVTEAMQTILPWTWEHTGLSTAISVIDQGNSRSIAVAERLGATLDAKATEAANQPGSPFHEPDGDEALVYRHHAPRATR